MNKIGIQNEINSKQTFCNSNMINICNSYAWNYLYFSVLVLQQSIDQFWF